jgi:hypothetical protein
MDIILDIDREDNPHAALCGLVGCGILSKLSAISQGILRQTWYPMVVKEYT